MGDLGTLLLNADRIPTPDLWPDIEHRKPRYESPGASLGRRLAIAALALLVAGAGVGLAATVFFGGEKEPAVATQPIVPEVTAKIPVDGWPTALAAGEGGVWVSVQARPNSPRGDAIVKIDPKTNAVVDTIPMKPLPSQIVAGLGAVWAATYEADRGAVITVIDPDTASVDGEIIGAGAPLAVGDGVLWASRHDNEAQGSSLVRIDPASNQIEATVPMPAGLWPVADVEVGEGSVWVLTMDYARGGGISLVRVDPSAGRVVSTFDTGRSFSTGLAVGSGAIWLSGLADGKEVVRRLDPLTGDPLERALDIPGFLPFAIEGDDIWFFQSLTRRICRLDTRTTAVASCTDVGIPGEAPQDPAVLDPETSTIWAVDTYGESVTRIELHPSSTEETRDPRVTAQVAVGQFPASVAAGEGAVWVTANDATPPERWFLARIDPATEQVTNEIDLGDAVDVATGAGWIWVAGRDRDLGPAVFRVDPQTLGVTAIPVSCEKCLLDQVVVEEDAIWATTSTWVKGRSGEVVRVDPASGSVVARVALPGDPRDLVVGADDVWVYSLTHHSKSGVVQGGTIYRIDSETNRLTATLLPGRVPPHSGIHTPPVLTWGHGYVWTSVITEDGYGIVRIDPQTNKIVQGPMVVDVFYPFAVDDEGVWFRGGNEDASPCINRLNAASFTVDESVCLHSTAIDAAMDPLTETIWVADYERRVTRIDLRANPAPQTR